MKNDPACLRMQEGSQPAYLASVGFAVIIPRQGANSGAATQETWPIARV